MSLFQSWLPYAPFGSLPVILMLVASVATPDWSPVTMGALFAALIGLYEGSMALARVLLAKRIAQQKALGYDVD